MRRSWLLENRAMVLALVFSVAVHAGVLLGSKRRPGETERSSPAFIIARLVRAEKVEREVKEEPRVGGKAGARAVSGLSLPPAVSGIVGVSAGLRARAAGPSPSDTSFGRTDGFRRGEGKDGIAGAMVLSPPLRAAVARLSPQPPLKVKTRTPPAEAGPPPAPGDVISEIRRRIESHKSYPGLARRNGWEGEVLVELQLDGQGALRDVQVVEESGYRVLDLATLSAVRSAGPYPPLSVRVRVPVLYRLGGR